MQGHRSPSRKDKAETSSTRDCETSVVEERSVQSRRSHSLSSLPLHVEDSPRDTYYLDIQNLSSRIRSSESFHLRRGSSLNSDAGESLEIEQCRKYVPRSPSRRFYGYDEDRGKRGFFGALFAAFSYFRKPGCGRQKRRNSNILTRERYHALPIKDLSPKGSPTGHGENVWGNHQREEKVHSGGRMDRANTLILVLAAVAFGWTLLLLFASPLPLIASVPQQVIDISININDHIEVAMKEEQEQLRKVTPIQLPGTDEVHPQVNSFSSLIKSEDICPHAHDSAMNASNFQKQFGAHEFANVTETKEDEEKRRVALFTGAYSNIRDGVSLTLNKMVAFLEENGHDILIFAPTNHEPALDAVGKILSVPSVPVPGRPEYRLSLVLSSYLQDQLRTFDPDIVHIATPDIVGFQALAWAKLNGIPTACSYHTRFNSYLEYYNFGFAEHASWLLWSQFYGRCDHVYVPSKEIKTELEEHGINNDIRIWARGVDPDVFNPQFRCPAWRNKIGAQEKEVVILLVCRMVWEKNLELFAKVIEGLQAAGMKFKSVVVGEGPARKDLQERLTQTTFLGSLKGADLSTAFANADIFFFPSTTETFGSTTLEAMASGLPVVVSNASGSNSLVSHNLNGFIADPHDLPSFEDYTSRLIADPSLREYMGLAGRNIAMSEFEYSKIFGDLINYYTDLVVGDRISNELQDPSN